MCVRDQVPLLIKHAWYDMHLVCVVCCLRLSVLRQDVLTHRRSTCVAV